MILYLTSSVMFLAHIVVTLDLDRSKTFQEILLHQGGFDYFVLCGMKIYMVVAVATVPKNGYNNFNQPMSFVTAASQVWALYVYLLASYESTRDLLNSSGKSKSKAPSALDSVIGNSASVTRE
ncbi:hypothetical protein HDU91_000601 [Kappamyces sp. JEL0680]|nr:hypothetical protein HDU91_000601 [Kappamyces sp. JEL0680]